MLAPKKSISGVTLFPGLTEVKSRSNRSVVVGYQVRVNVGGRLCLKRFWRIPSRSLSACYDLALEMYKKILRDHPERHLHYLCGQSKGAKYGFPGLTSTIYASPLGGLYFKWVARWREGGVRKSKEFPLENLREAILFLSHCHHKKTGIKIPGSLIDFAYRRALDTLDSESTAGTQAAPAVIPG